MLTRSGSVNSLENHPGTGPNRIDIAQQKHLHASSDSNADDDEAALMLVEKTPPKVYRQTARRGRGGLPGRSKGRPPVHKPTADEVAALSPMRKTRQRASLENNGAAAATAVTGNENATLTQKRSRNTAKDASDVPQTSQAVYNRRRQHTGLTYDQDTLEVSGEDESDLYVSDGDHDTSSPKKKPRREVSRAQSPSQSPPTYKAAKAVPAISTQGSKFVGPYAKALHKAVKVLKEQGTTKVFKSVRPRSVL